MEIHSAEMTILMDKTIIPGPESVSDPETRALLRTELDEVLDRDFLPQQEFVLCSREDTSSVDISYRVRACGEPPEGGIPDWLDMNKHGEYDVPARDSYPAAWDLPNPPFDVGSTDLGTLQSEFDKGGLGTLFLRLEPDSWKPPKDARRRSPSDMYRDTEPESPLLGIFRWVSNLSARVMLRVHLEPVIQVGGERLSAEYCHHAGIESLSDERNMEPVGYRPTIDAAIRSDENEVAAATRLGEHLQVLLGDEGFVPTLYKAAYPKNTQANLEAMIEGKELAMHYSLQQHPIIADALARMIAGRGRALEDGTGNHRSISVASPESLAPIFRVPDVVTLNDNEIGVPVATRATDVPSLIETFTGNSGETGHPQSNPGTADDSKTQSESFEQTSDGRSSKDEGGASSGAKQVTLTADADGDDEELPPEARPVAGVFETYAGPTCETCGATYDHVSKAAECHGPAVLSNVTKPQNTSISRTQPDIVYSQHVIDRLREEPITSDFVEALGAISGATSLSEALRGLQAAAPDDPQTLDSWALTFLAAVELARVGRLPEYTLHDSMTSLRDACLTRSEHEIKDLTESSLLPGFDQPILETDKLNGHRYYELTSAAVEAEAVPNARNASLPVFGTSLRYNQCVVFGIHHAAVEYDVEWYQAPHTLSVSGRDSFSGFTAEDELSVVGTVIDEDPYSNPEKESFEMNPEVQRRIVQQYARFTDFETESLWIAKNTKVAQGVLDVLADQGLIDLSQSVYGSSYSIGQLQKHFVGDLDSEGIDSIKSVSQLHQKG